MSKLIKLTPYIIIYLIVIIIYTGNLFAENTNKQIYTLNEGPPALVEMAKSMAKMAGKAKPDKVMLVGNDDNVLMAMRGGLPADTSYIAIPYIHQGQVDNAIKLHKPDTVLILKPGPENSEDIAVAQSTNIPKLSHNSNINFQNIGASSFAAGRLANVWQGDVKLGMPISQTVQDTLDWAKRIGARDISVVHNSEGGSHAIELKRQLEEKGLKVRLVPDNSLSKTTMISSGMGAAMRNPNNSSIVLGVDGRDRYSPILRPNDQKNFSLQNQTGDDPGSRKLAPAPIPPPIRTIHNDAPKFPSSSPDQIPPKPSLPSQTFRPMATPSQEIKPSPRPQTYKKPSQDYIPSPRGFSSEPTYTPPPPPAPVFTPPPIYSPPPVYKPPQIYIPRR